MKLFASEIRDSTYSHNRQEFENILGFLEKNPLREFCELEIEYDEKWQNYNSKAALDWIDANETSRVGFRSAAPYFLNGFILRNLTDCSIGFYFSNQLMVDVVAIENLREYLRNSRNILPNFSDAVITADDRDNDFWLDVAKTEPLPDCFGSRLGWYHVISPRGYESFFRREDLLNTPALNVEELDDGTICILNYADPLDYSKPETTEKIIEITNYLTEKWYEFDPSPTFDLIEQT